MQSILGTQKSLQYFFCLPWFLLSSNVTQSLLGEDKWDKPFCGQKPSFKIDRSCIYYRLPKGFRTVTHRCVFKNISGILFLLSSKTYLYITRQISHKILKPFEILKKILSINHLHFLSRFISLKCCWCASEGATIFCQTHFCQKNVEWEWNGCFMIIRHFKRHKSEIFFGAKLTLKNIHLC